MRGDGALAFGVIAGGVSRSASDRRIVLLAAGPPVASTPAQWRRAAARAAYAT